MTDNISINSSINSIDVTQQVNTVAISTPGPQGPGGSVFLASTASVGWAFSASNAINSASSNISASSRFSSSVINGLVTTSSITNTFINVASVQPTQEGSIFYDPAVHHSLNLVTDTATPQELGQQVLARVVNGTADNTTLTKGTIVYISGATGNRVRVDRAIANDVNKHDVLGMVYDDIANNAEGFVLTFGVIDDVNTGGYTAGDTLYLSATNAGQYTNVAPSHPNYKYELGTVARANTNNGRILLHPNPAYSSNTASGNILLSDGYRSVGSTNATLDLLGNLRVATASVAGDTTIGGNLNVTGNFFVAGTTASISASNIVLNDPLLYLADGNPANINDIGIIGSFTPGAPATYQHTGLVRDASDNTWKLFSGVVAEPTNTVDFTSASYDTLQLGRLVASPTSGIAAIISAAPSNIGLQVNPNATAGADSARFYHTNGSVYSSFDNAGRLTIRRDTTITPSLGSPAVGVLTGSDTAIGLIIRGNSAQSADLQQWQNSAGAILNFINASGQLIVGSSQPLISTSAAMISVYNSSSNTPGIIVRGASLQATSLQEWQNAAGATIARIYQSGWIQSAIFRDLGGNGPYFSMSNSQINLQAAAANNKFVITGFSTGGAYAQTGDLQQWLWSNGTTTYPLSTVNKDGQFVIGSSVALTYSSTPTGSAMVSIIGTSSATTPLIIKRAAGGNGVQTEWQDQNGAQSAFVAFGQFSAQGYTTAANVSGLGSAPLGPAAFRAFPAAGTIGYLVRGATSQTNDLIQMQDVSNNILSTFNAAGQLIVGSSQPIVSTSAAMLSIYNSSSNTPGLIIRSASLNNVDVQQWQNAAGTIQAKMTRFGELIAAGGVYSGSNPDTNYQSQVVTGTTSTVGFGIKGNTAQVDLQRFLNSSNLILSVINASGQFVIGGSVALVNSNAANTGQASAMLTVIQSSSLNPGIIVRGVVNPYTSASHANMIEFQTLNGVAQFGVNHLGFGFGNMSGDKFFYDRTYFRSTGINQIPVFIQGVTGQTADLTRWYPDSTSAYPTSVINASGQFIIGGSVSIASPVSSSPSMLSIYPTASTVPAIMINWPRNGSSNEIFRIQDLNANRIFSINDYGDVLVGVSQIGTFYSGNYSNAGPIQAKANLWATVSNQAALAVFGAANQTADIMQIRNSSGSVLSAVNASGQLIIGSSAALVSTSAAMISIYSTASTNPALIVRAASLQTALLSQWQAADGTSIAYVDSSGGFRAAGTGTFGSSYISGTQFSVTSNSTSNITSLFKAAAGQAADMMQWQNSAGLTLSEINASGQFVIGGSVTMFASAQGPSSTSAAMLSIYQPASINAGIIVRSASPSGVSAFELQRNDGQPIFSVTGGGALWFDSNVSSPQIRWGSAVVLNGGSSPNSLVFTPFAASRFAMTFRGLSGQTGDLLQFQDSNASALAVFNASGMQVLGSFGGSTTPISSTGYNGSAYLTIYQNASANSGIIFRRNNANSQAFAIEIQDQGGGQVGTWNSFGQLTLRSGTNQATNAAITLAPGSTVSRGLVIVAPQTGQASSVFEVQGGYSGNASPVFAMSPLGQISTGSGYSAIFGGSVMISVFNRFANGQGIIIRGAPSQSANLQEWQNSTGNILLSVASGGAITASAASGIPLSIFSNNGVGLFVKGDANNDIFQAQINAAATNRFIIDKNGRTAIGSPATVKDSAFLTVNSAFISNPALVVSGISGQTVDIQRWYLDTTLIGAIQKDGTASFNNAVITNASFVNIAAGSTQYAIDAGSLGGIISSSYALLDSPALTGIPTAPTAGAGTNTTQLATTQFVRTEISNLVNSAPAALDTLNELAIAIGNDPNFATTVLNNISTASSNAYNAAVTYANSASLNAYNTASAFTQNASVGLYNFIVSASQGIITAGSVQWSTSAGNSITSSSALYAASLVGPIYGTGANITNNTIAPAALTSSVVTIGTSTIGLGTTLATLPVTALSSSIITLGTTQLNLGGTFGNLDRVVIGNNTASTASFTDIYSSGNVVYNQTTNSQSVTSYTLALSDSGKFIEMNNTNRNLVIIPLNATVPFANGTRVDIIQTGLGNTTASAEAGVTLNYYSPTTSASVSIKSQWSALTLIKRSTNSWLAIGNIA